MNLIIAIFAIVSMATSLPAKDVQQIQDKVNNIQTKRDLSLSYAATDIGSKEGTRVKTITVIKNVIGKKDKPLKIDPKLHKDEDWGSHFRDNFDSYGAIPDVPDIDELFEFVNKKENKEPKENKHSDEEENKGNKKDSSEKESEEDSSSETTVLPAPVEEVVNEDKVEKIKGEAELIQSGNKKDKPKSQSLQLSKYIVKESPKEADSHPIKSYASAIVNKNEKYIQSASVPYYYPQPNPSSNVNSFTGNTYQSPQSQKGRGSISVSTPSGKKFDVPVTNVTDSSPYIAPSYRKTQNLPVGPQFVSSSQRPYIAPNLRKSYEVQTTASNSNDCANNSTTNTQQAATLNLQEIQPNIRPIRFGVYKPNSPRSRGLRY